MCKGLVKSLLGGGSAETSRPAQPVATVDTTGSEADVKNTDITSQTASGREGSGRVKLGGGTKRNASVPGLSL